MWLKKNIQYQIVLWKNLWNCEIQWTKIPALGLGFALTKHSPGWTQPQWSNYPWANGKETHEDSWYFFTSTISLYLFYNLNCHKMALLPHMKKLKPTTITIGNVSWSFMKSHNNIWQAFLKIWDQMEIRRSSMKIPKNELKMKTSQ